VKFPRWLVSALLPGMLLPWVACGQSPAAPGPSAGGAPAAVKADEPAKPHWSVTVDVQMVAMPQELALDVLGGLQSEEQNKVEAAVGRIQELLQKTQAKLMAWPRTTGVEGIRVVSESIVEKRYPSEFKEPEELQPPPADKKAPGGERSLTPVDSETRNTGATLEVEAAVLDGGKRISVDLAASRVVLLGTDSYETGQTKTGEPVRLSLPQFASSKAQTTLNLRNGQHLLIGVHKLTDPENYIELFIAHAVTTKLD
jgi:hypothetical protein